MTNESSNDTTSNGELAVLRAELEERERTLATLEFLPTPRTLPLVCARTGVTIATLTLLQQAGKLPYLSQWKDSQAFHPLFSLGQAQLLSWTRKNWNRVFREASDNVTHREKEQFSVAFMAILHSLGCVDQTIPALPSFGVVANHMQRLLELAYWFHYLDSRRFRFPTFRISKINNNASLQFIGEYFDICDSRRKDWEKGRDARLEDAQLEAARRAEKAVRSGHAKVINKKALWNWFKSFLVGKKKYELPEWKEWLEDSERLWLGSENTQLQFSLDDCDAIEDVFIVECTLGTMVSHAFSAELNKIRSHIDNHAKIFSIEWGDVGKSNVQRVTADGERIGSSAEDTAPPEPGPAPSLGEFTSRSDYTRAHAKWYIRNKQYEAWKQRQQQQQATAAMEEPEQEQLLEDDDQQNQEEEDDDADENV